MKTKYIVTVLAVFSVITIAGWFAWSAVQPASYTKASLGGEEDVLGFLSGLRPGDFVSYKIQTDRGDVVSGQKFVDIDGLFELPSLNQDIEQKPVGVELDIVRDDQPLSLNFVLNQAKQDLTISGEGFEKFSDIEIERGEERIDTKSDWIGAFEITGLGLSNVAKSASEGVKVALYGGFLSDEQDAKPLTLQVLYTEGGGGPTNAGLNQWREEACGRPELSICMGDKMRDRMNDIKARYVPALQEMTAQFTSVMMKYMEIVGGFMDAKMQLQTQAQIQKMQAQAHKDYHPSDQMCRFGSFMKTVAKVEESAKFNTLLLNRTLMDRYTNARRSSTPGDLAEIVDQQTEPDLASRLKQFRTTYCDPKDHNDGLEYLCQHNPNNIEIGRNEKIGGQDPARLNNDIDFTRVIDSRLTLDVDFADNEVIAGSDPEKRVSADEEDVIALAKNLYWPEALAVSTPGSLPEKSSTYMDARRMMAIHNVAHNSYVNIVGSKSETNDVTDGQSGPAFMKAFMREFGLSDMEINDVLGESPSYYAQMEVLTKKMYQDPSFYTNLYDKPVNVARIGVSMEAIKLMQMRDWFNTSTRREMLSSMLLETDIAKEVDKVSQKIGAAGIR